MLYCLLPTTLLSTYLLKVHGREALCAIVGRADANLDVYCVHIICMCVVNRNINGR